MQIAAPVGRRVGSGRGGLVSLIGFLPSGNSVIGHITKRSPVAELVEQVGQLPKGLEVQILAEIVHVAVSLGKTLNSKFLPMGLAAPCTAAAAHWCARG